MIRRLKDTAEQLIELFGDDVVTPVDQIGDRYLRDWSGEFLGQPLALVRPRTVDEVAEAVRWCYANAMPVALQGGHTGLVGSGTAASQGTEIILNLERLKKVRSIDPLAGNAVVEAGCVLQELKDSVERANAFFPLSLGAQGSCQVGGNIGTNAGGINVLRYGMMRDLVLDLEVVLGDGRLLSDLRGLRKRNTGYDWKQLFIGSEGTLGVVTAACLKLFPKPTQVETIFCATPSVDAVLSLFHTLRQRAGDTMSAFELLMGDAVEFANEQFPALISPLIKRKPVYVLIEFSSAGGPPLRAWLESVLAEFMENETILDGAVAQSAAQAQSFWSVREAIVEAQSLTGRHLRTDVSVPTSRVGEFIREAEAIVSRLAPEGRTITYGHVGDGNIHLNVVRRELADEANFIAKLPSINEAINDLVDKLSGAISAEHGIGLAKRQSFAKRVPVEELRLMRELKLTLDPKGILNPGRIFETGDQIDEVSCTAAL